MPQHVKSDREFLSTSEASAKTGLSSRYIQRLLQEGRLEGFKASIIWFVYEDSLSAFLAQPRKRGPKGARTKSDQSQSITPPENGRVEGATHTGEYIQNGEGQG